MKYLIATALALVSPLAFAAATMTFSLEGLVHAVIFLIIAGIIIGLLFFLVNRAPWIPENIKTWITYLIWFIVIIIVINFLLSLIGHPLFELR